PHIARWICRIVFECALKTLDGFRQFPSLFKKITAWQVIIQRFAVDRHTIDQPRLFGGCELGLNLAGDRARDLALHPQRVAKVALIAFGPQLPFGARMDQSRADAYAVS